MTVPDRPTEHAQCGNGQSQRPSRPRLSGHRLAWKVMGVLLAVGLGLAGHVLVVERNLRARHLPQPSADYADAWAANSTMPASDPFALASQPFAMEHLRPVTQPPAWVVSPPGSRLLYGFSRDIGGIESWSLHYAAASSPDDVESFYRTAMPKLGYKLVKRTGIDGSSALTFVQAHGESYWVGIRQADRKDQAEIALAISRPLKR